MTAAGSGIAAAIATGLAVLLWLSASSVSHAASQDVPGAAVAGETESIAPVQAEEPKPVLVAAAPQTAAQEPPVAPSPLQNAGSVHVWDTGASKPVADDVSLVGRGAGWTQVAPADTAAHQFGSGCVVDNEKLWLHIPQDASSPVRIAARHADGPVAVVPITFGSTASKATGPRVIRVEQLADDAALVTWSGGGASVGVRVEANKSWVEVRPGDGAKELAIGTSSRFVVVPTEFGEDAILDAAIPMERRSVPLPQGNTVLALQQEAHSIAMLTFPSNSQGGEVTLGASGGSAGKLVTRISAKFNDQSVFVGVLPQSDLWFSDRVGKKYSASGQYPLNWKLPCAGVWRLAGRIQGQYYISEVPHDRLIFACSKSGTLECLIGYLSRPLERAADDAVTPMTVYRETLGGNDGNAYLAESDAGDPVELRKTRYRDVCNSIDDIKDVWRNSPAKLKSDPDYVPELLADCQSIIGRMDLRLRDYATLTQHVGEIAAQADADGSVKADTGLNAFRSTVQKCDTLLKALPPVSTDHLETLVKEIKLKAATPPQSRASVSELDALAERLRDVASDQEVRLKKLRAVALQLSDACTKQRKAASGPERPYVTALGRDCRRILRTRDVEE
ncbi:MAG: hypothetical protein U0992_14745 [Planctomycetaceae bacterium]